MTDKPKKTAKHVSIDDLLIQNYVDMLGTPIDKSNIGYEIEQYLKHYAPKEMYVKIEPAIPPFNPYVTLYIDRESFEKGYRP